MTEVANFCRNARHPQLDCSVSTMVAFADTRNIVVVDGDEDRFRDSVGLHTVLELIPSRTPAIAMLSRDLALHTGELGNSGRGDVACLPPCDVTLVADLSFVVLYLHQKTCPA